MQIKKIGVAGAGAMGLGIAQVFAHQGFAVVLYDLNQVQLNKAKGEIEKNLAGAVAKNKMSEAEKNTCLNNIQFTEKLEDLKADLTVEAIVEKRYLFCGAVSLGIISLLLITSTDFAVKLLKFKNWKSLHRLIHVAFVFILVHVFSIEKADLIKYAFILIPLFLAQTLRFSFSFAKNRKVPFQPPHS